MKVVIIGGTGLIGRKLASKLQSGGHQVWRLRHLPGLIASRRGPQEGVDPSERCRRRHELPVLRGQCRTGFLSELYRAFVERRRGSRRLALRRTIGGWRDRIRDSGYLRAKRVQERMIEAGGGPYTVLSATQLFEFIKAIADGGTEGKAVYMSPSKFQPVAADDVAATLAEIATAQPKNGVVELAGPEASSMTEFIQSFLSSIGDERKVIADPDAKYFGAILDQDGLAPSGEFIAGPTRFADWVRAQC